MNLRDAIQRMRAAQQDENTLCEFSDEDAEALRVLLETAEAVAFVDSEQDLSATHCPALGDGRAYWRMCFYKEERDAVRAETFLSAVEAVRKAREGER